MVKITALGKRIDQESDPLDRFFDDTIETIRLQGTFACTMGGLVTMDCLNRVLRVVLVVVSLAAPGFAKDGKSKGAEHALCETNLARLWQEHRIKQPSEKLIMKASKFDEWVISEEDLSTTYFTSDQHFGHDRIISMAKRPFKSTQEMDEKMILKWNHTVPHDGTVFVVGDFSMNLDQVKRILPRLNGVKILIAGNHDLPHPENQKTRTPEDFECFRQQYRDAGFLDVVLGYRIQMPGVQGFNLTHYPYLTLGEAKAAEPTLSGVPHRIVDDGHALVCGHVHCSWRTQGKQINVGVDFNDYAPVPAERLRSQLRELVR